MPEIRYGDIITSALKKDAFSKRSLPMIGLSILEALIAISIWFFLVGDLIENFRVITTSPLIMLLEVLVMLRRLWMIFIPVVVVNQNGYVWDWATSSLTNNVSNVYKAVCVVDVEGNPIEW